MRVRLLLAAAVTMTLAACGESATEPQRMSPTGPSRDLTCRSGYHIATRADGAEYCEADDAEGMRRPDADDAPRRRERCTAAARRRAGALTSAE